MTGKEKNTSVDKIIVFVDTEIGSENKNEKEYVEEVLKGGVECVIKEIFGEKGFIPLPKGKKEMIFNFKDSPRKSTLASVRILAKMTNGQKVEAAKIRKSFASIPWCSEAQIYVLSGENWIIA